ncbi:MAG: ferrochelatase [Bryobacteraceae bacterium]|nr:ferrochelatase [Bryobacteraceae bacterium]
MERVLTGNKPGGYDAVLVVGFGGPEKPEDVMPFLDNVLRGRNVPEERKLEVAENYFLFGGKSPLNDQNRALIRALQQELKAKGPDLPVYWGNRNWHPLLADTLRQMKNDGVRRALAFVTSAYSSYSGCRQYREDILRAQAEVGHGAPVIDKIRSFYNHPGFVEPMIERTRAAFASLPEERRGAAHLVFTAHSIPVSMARTSAYERQLQETCRLVAEGIGRSDYRLVYQSRSGPPGQPWLEPDIRDYFSEIAAAEGSRDVVVVPIGFISCHMEVLFDLDTQAREFAAQLGLQMVRAQTVDTHPKFIAMIRELILERLDPATPKRAIGRYGPNHDFCPVDCCPSPQRHGVPSGAASGRTVLECDGPETAIPFPGNAGAVRRADRRRTGSSE